MRESISEGIGLRYGDGFQFPFTILHTYDPMSRGEGATKDGGGSSNAREPALPFPIPSLIPNPLACSPFPPPPTPSFPAWRSLLTSGTFRTAWKGRGRS